MENTARLAPILMMQPYARLVVLHLAVLFGGWIVLTLARRSWRSWCSWH